MGRIIKMTGDGSPTLFVPELNEHYHSVYGAMAESAHVFIENGLNRIKKNEIAVFEVGFGTGLNAWLTCLSAGKDHKRVSYHTIEINPLDRTEWIEYKEHLTGKEGNSLFEFIHECPWEKEIEITPWFKINKIAGDIAGHNTSMLYDVIYFDAFGPEVQPELWGSRIFNKIAAWMNTGALLTTYSVKGTVRRNLQAGGLKVERIPGPPGKRQMTLAFKPFQ